MEIREIPLDKIKGSIYQPRRREDREIGRLMESIAVNGLRNPAVVRQRAGFFEVVSGHRRIAALEALLKRGTKELPRGEARIAGGRAFINCLLFDMRGEKEAVVSGFLENYERLDLSPYEQAVCIKEFVEEKGFTQDEISKRFGINKVNISYMISSLDPKSLPAHMIKAWKEGKLTFAHVKVLVRLRRYSERQRELFEMIIKKRLASKDAEFWCLQMLDEPDIPLDERRFDALEKRLLERPLLKNYIDNKLIRLGRSKRGEKIMLSFNGEDELKQMLSEILETI
ncbi:MAG: ParB N-terminal domain-containing protein [Deltaproteobacteria bacterium]|nr:ParB N-terminal domain-containing protein [Deltaproteobacteria bacterium]